MSKIFRICFIFRIPEYLIREISWFCLCDSCLMGCIRYPVRPWNILFLSSHGQTDRDCKRKTWQQRAKFTSFSILTTLRLPLQSFTSLRIQLYYIPFLTHVTQLFCASPSAENTGHLEAFASACGIASYRLALIPFTFLV